MSNTGKLINLGADLPTDHPYLLFIHGTVSSFEGGYGNIPVTEWNKLHAHYGGRVLAFNHRTVTDSPVGNALDLLKQLPSGITLDLTTHSRGGLVGDVLARCDERISADERGYSASEQQLIREDFEGTDDLLPADSSDNTSRQEAFSRASANLAQEMANVTRLAAQSPTRINCIIRVAAPSAGTELLSERLDHYLNAAFNLLKLAAQTVVILEPLINILEAFTVAVVAERTDLHSIPGLYAMVPDRAFARLHNATPTRLPSTLISIAGDSEVGGSLRQSLR